MNTDLIGFINIFSGVAQILIGFVTLFSDFKNKIKRRYFLSVLFLGCWSISMFFYANPVLFDTTTWLKIVYTFAYLMTLGLIFFAMVYPREEKKQFNAFFFVIFAYMILILIALWFSDLILVSTANLPEQFNTKAYMGDYYILYGLPEFLTAGYVVGYYLKQVMKSEGVEKKQVQFYVAGGIIMLLPVIIFDFFLPLVFGDTLFYKYSTLGNVMWTVIVGYSVITTRFLDIRVLIGSITVSIAKAIFITIVLFLVFFELLPLMDITLSITGFLKLLPVGIILAIIFGKVFQYIEEFFSNQFVYVYYHPVKTIQEYTRRNAELLKAQEILDNLTQTIAKSFKASFTVALLLDKKRNLVTESIKGRTEIESANIREIVEVWDDLNSSRLIIYSEIIKTKKAGKRIIDEKRNKIVEFMKKYQIEILFPVEGESFVGVLAVGINENKSSYTVNDINFLDSIMQSTQITLTRSILYQELQTFNETLQEKVDIQTEELQKRLDELQEARRKEADMIDIMGHELRTPATIVKLNAQLLEKFIGIIQTDRGSFEKYLGRIKVAVENEIKLINTLLSSAKLEGDKIEITLEEVKLKEEIDLAISGQEREMKDKGLELINNIQEEIPNVYADKARVIEILNNLISNAVKYTTKGSITINSEHDNDFVKISILDTGNGIAKEDIPKLGQKFYRAGNYINVHDNVSIVRPGGTGLGLYVTFNLIKRMGGEIKVESELGKGSTFSFTLPRFNGQKVDLINHVDMFTKLGLRK